MTMMMRRERERTEKELACFLRPFHPRQARKIEWPGPASMVSCCRFVCVSVKGRLLWCGGRETKRKQGLITTAQR